MQRSRMNISICKGEMCRAPTVVYHQGTETVLSGSVLLVVYRGAAPRAPFRVAYQSYNDVMKAINNISPFVPCVLHFGDTWASANETGGPEKAADDSAHASAPCS